MKIDVDLYKVRKRPDLGLRPGQKVINHKKKDRRRLSTKKILEQYKD